MLTLIQPDGCIHGSINHTLTVTGRFSSSAPNLQNIPRKDNSVVKSVFVSRFKGGRICQSDFTSLEIYIQAILTGDRQLIQDLIDGIDMHCMRAAAKFHVAYEIVKAAVAAGDKEWKLRRTKSKEFSFQRAYGAGVAKIAESTGMSEDEVRALVEADEARYPDIQPYYDKLMELLEETKRTVRKVVPHPDFKSKMVELRTGYFRSPDNKLYTYLEQTSPKYVVERSGKFSGFSPTEVKNYVVQGTGAEWAKAAMWLAIRAFYSRRNFGHKALLINQVHDAVYADFHPEVALEAAALLHACMSAASEFMEWYFGWHQPVHVPSETTWGKSMIQERRIVGINQRAEKYREELRNNYMRKAA